MSGTDSSGAPVYFAQYKSKVVMLVFWLSFDISVEKTIELLALMRKIEKQYTGKKFALIGVNKDQLVNLRELEPKVLGRSRCGILLKALPLLQKSPINVRPHRKKSRI